MALTIDVVTSADDSSGTATSVTSPAFTTTQAGELILVFGEADSDGGGGLTATVNGVSAALLIETFDGLGSVAGGAAVFSFWASSILTSVTAKVTGNTFTSYSITVVSFKGAKDGSATNGTASVGTKVGNTSSGSLPSLSITTTGANSWIFANFTDATSSTARTVGTAQTLIHQLTGVTPTLWVQRQNSATSGSGTVVVTNVTAPLAENWNGSAVEVLAAASTINPDDWLPRYPDYYFDKIGVIASGAQ